MATDNEEMNKFVTIVCNIIDNLSFLGGKVNALLQVTMDD